MEKQRLIEMLNRDLADEHAAVVRYLVHGWMEGEDTPLGSSLLSISREEMWHMHWLGMIIGDLGGEPNFKPADYPHDPTNRGTLLESYVGYEKRLIPHYLEESNQVSDGHIKRVLQREAWESAIHARKFQRRLDKLSPQERASLPEEGHGLPQSFIDMLQEEVDSKYAEMLHHVRTSWVFQKHASKGWQLMDQAMEKMKQLAHFAEHIAEDGVAPVFEPERVEASETLNKAMLKGLDDLGKALSRHEGVKEDPEATKHGGFLINLDLTLQQEAYQRQEMEDWLKAK